jgi:hypothetical protein|tara:strand:- start:98 stop:298 length:201 start_codon:yes stop_codon:yes gene_type:complete
MQMSKKNNSWAEATVWFCDALEGKERTQFIENIEEHVEHAMFMKYPKTQIRKYNDLLSRLVKKFGH